MSKVLAFLQDRGFTVEGEFIPFSKSRNAKEPHYSLNWRGRIKRLNRTVIEADYSAGEGHLKSYKFNARRTLGYDGALRLEAETGYPHRVGTIFKNRKRHEFPADSFLSCIAMDCDVLDYSSFEDWAESIGYGSDSRKAEAIYRACLEQALPMRTALGEPDFTTFTQLGRDE